MIYSRRFESLIGLQGEPICSLLTTSALLFCLLSAHTLSLSLWPVPYARLNCQLDRRKGSFVSLTMCVSLSDYLTVSVCRSLYLALCLAAFSLSLLVARRLAKRKELCQVER